MMRVILYLILTVLVISLLRSVIGVLAKAALEFLHPVNTASSRPRPTVDAGGELKRDPVCGTFISTATALQKKAGGEVFYFCSPECRERFKG